MRQLPEKSTEQLPVIENEKLHRFYVMTPKAIQLALQQEAAARATNPWTLGGIVLERWLLSGCPDFGPQIYESELQLPDALPLKQVATRK